MAWLTAVIMGTAAWEAMMLGRPVLVFVDFPSAGVGRGVLQCGDLSSLPAAVSDALAMSAVPEELLELFIAAILAESFEFPTHLFWCNVT